MASKSIPDSSRNAFFAQYCKEKHNKSCVDCGSPNPQWATAYFGILFCLECSGQHRSLGTHLTFVRSITMDTWKEHEIAAMQAGGNAAMITWWKDHGVNPKASIRDKYSNPATQAYRQKIKCLVEGKEYVEGSVPVSGSVSKSSSGSSSSGKKKSHKASGKSSRSTSSPAVATNNVGTMFSFDDAPSTLKSSTGSAPTEDSDSDAEFESFVTQPQKTVHAVPNYGEPKGFDYSDPRLKQYEGMKGIGSDELNNPGGNQEPKAEQPSELFSVFASGWNSLTQVANTAKDKVVQSTGELKGKVAQAKIGEKATSFIQFLWTGEEMAGDGGGASGPNDDDAVVASGGFQNQQVAAPQQAFVAPVKNSTPVQQRVVSPSFGDDDGWGAWDGNDSGSAAPVSKEDAWGAWGSSTSKSAAAAPSSGATTPSPSVAPQSSVAKEDPWAAWGSSPGESETTSKEKAKKPSKEKKKSSASLKSSGKSSGQLVDLSFGASSPANAAPEKGGPPAQTLSLLDMLSASNGGTSSTAASVPATSGHANGWDDRANDDWAAFLATKNK